MRLLVNRVEQIHTFMSLLCSNTWQFRDELKKKKSENQKSTVWLSRPDKHLFRLEVDQNHKEVSGSKVRGSAEFQIQELGTDCWTFCSFLQAERTLKLLCWGQGDPHQVNSYESKQGGWASERKLKTNKKTCHKVQLYKNFEPLEEIRTKT